MKEKDSKFSWSNSDNAAYYENIPVETQQEITVIGGLDVHSDLKLIDKYITQATKILEVGACYGRVLNYLLERNPKANIHAIERSSKFMNILKQKFAEQVCLHEMDLRQFASQEKFDLILWMWSGISDFAPTEQIDSIKRLAQSLDSNGYLIIDTFSHKLKPAKAAQSNDQSYYFHLENCELHGYIPSPIEMQQYAKVLEFNKFEHMPYKTVTQRDRNIYIFGN